MFEPIEGDQEKSFQLKKHVKLRFHLYVSEVPCGDASMGLVDGIDGVSQAPEHKDCEAEENKEIEKEPQSLHEKRLIKL